MAVSSLGIKIHKFAAEPRRAFIVVVFTCAHFAAASAPKFSLPRNFRCPIERKGSTVLKSHVGLGTMANYRAYHIGPDGRIRSGVDLDCADDAEAIEAASKLVGEFAVELWHDKRMVARLETPPTRAP